MRLSHEQLVEQLKNCKGWELNNNQEIERTFSVEQYLKGVSLANQIAEIAEREDHHPRIIIDYGRITVSLSTHDQGGITEKDIRSAKLYNQLINE